MRRWLIIVYLVLASPLMLMVTSVLGTTIYFFLWPSPEGRQGPWKPSFLQDSLGNFSFALYFFHYVALLFSFWISALHAARGAIYFAGALAISGVFLYNNQVPPDPGPFDAAAFLFVSVFLIYLAVMELFLVYGLWACWRMRSANGGS